MLLALATFLGPYPFKISNQIEVVDRDLLFSFGESTYDAQLPLKILSKLPKERNGEMVWDVDSVGKYNATIKIGSGNCSNLVFGFASVLYYENYPYEVIHLLSPEDFLFGSGHTVISIPFEYKGETRVGFYDILENGFPLNQEGDFASRSDIIRGNFAERHGIVFNPFGDGKRESNYWAGDYIRERGALGVIKGQDVNEYFAITDKLFWPLGNKQFERYVYDGLALFLGYLPKIYISEATYNRLTTSSVNWVCIHAARAILLIIRIVVAVGTLLLIFDLLQYLYDWLFKRKGLNEADSSKSQIGTD